MKHKFKIKLDEKLIDADNWLDIPELGISVEIEVHDKNKSWEELGLSKRENELLTVEQCIWLANSKYAKKLKIDGGSSEDDFFIKQPFNLNKKRKNVAGFGAGPGVAGFGCLRRPGGSLPSLGVRFVRKKISKSNCDVIEKLINKQTKINIEIAVSKNYNKVTIGIQDEPLNSAIEEEFRAEIKKLAAILREEAETQLKLMQLNK